LGLADGSHDDGAGVVQSMEVLNIFKNLKPKKYDSRSSFLNEEEMDLEAVKYEELSLLNKENHIFSLESDSGGFSPRGFSLECDDANFNNISSYKVHLNLI
jgi:hypothetical protein